jgi:hypothetical protein
MWYVRESYVFGGATHAMTEVTNTTKAMMIRQARLNAERGHLTPNGLGRPLAIESLGKEAMRATGGTIHNAASAGAVSQCAMLKNSVERTR